MSVHLGKSLGCTGLSTIKHSDLGLSSAKLGLVILFLLLRQRLRNHHRLRLSAPIRGSPPEQKQDSQKQRERGRRDHDCRVRHRIAERNTEHRFQRTYELRTRIHCEDSRELRQFGRRNFRAQTSPVTKVYSLGILAPRGIQGGREKESCLIC